MLTQLKNINFKFSKVIENANLKQNYSSEFAKMLEYSLSNYGVLIFKNQNLSRTYHRRLMQSFLTMKGIANTHISFSDVGNVDDSGNVKDKESVEYTYLPANLLWHTDGSYLEKPVQYSSLLARALPDNPPPTQYADMRAAWNALSKKQQTELEKYTVVHTIARSREQMNIPVVISDNASSFRELHNKELIDKSVHHPLVRVHSTYKQKSLYLSSHASHIVELPMDEGRELLQHLIKISTIDEFVYTHQWELHDLVLWDNRWTMHRSTPYNGSQERKMRHCCFQEQ